MTQDEAVEKLRSYGENADQSRPRDADDVLLGSRCGRRRVMRCVAGWVGSGMRMTHAP